MELTNPAVTDGVNLFVNIVVIFLIKLNCICKFTENKLILS